MLAAIDVGSNTVRLLLGSLDESGRLIPLEYHRRITRLAGGFHPEPGLSPEAMERTLAALTEFGQRIAAADIESSPAVGTAALRRAANGQSFLEQVRQETGLRIRVIDGEEEARLAAAGVLAALDPRPESCLIFDIGGGSTEFILVAEGAIRFHRSYPLGVVTLCENSPDSTRQAGEIALNLERLRTDLAKDGLLQLIDAPGCLLVGTAGTVTSLAALELQMDAYDWRRVNNLRLTLRTLKAWQRRLAALDIAGREALHGLEAGRGDLILPGVEIVLQLLAGFGKRLLTVSDFGLLEGLLLATAETRR